MSGDGCSESSLGDADAVARAENVERVLAEAVAQHKQQVRCIEDVPDGCSLCRVNHDVHF
jgi:hypothetical protein